MRISVIVATRNRPKDVARVLKSLTAQSVPVAEYEVVVVDNAPSDEVRKVVQSYERAGNVKYVTEPRPGLSNARNTGIRESSGNLLAFIDDDAIADRYWLECLMAAFDGAGALCVGGRVEGHWLCLKPRWFPPEAEAMLSLLDLGNQVIQFTPPTSAPIGTNIAFRRKVFDRYGFFNPRLGRGSGGLSGGEETEIFMKLTDAGERVVYSHRAIVTHAVERDRLRPSRLIRLSFEGGRLAAMLNMGRRPAQDVRSGHDEGRVPFRMKALRAAMKTAMAAGYALQKVLNPLKPARQGKKAKS